MSRTRSYKAAFIAAASLTLLAHCNFNWYSTSLGLSGFLERGNGLSPQTPEFVQSFSW